MIEPAETIDISLCDGAVSRVRRVGSGEAVLFSHGNGFSCDAFAPFVSVLAESYSVYCFDHRGHGSGPAIDVDGLTLELLVDDLRDVAAAVRAHHGGGPLHGVCHSIAAVFAFRVQADAPGSFDSIVAYEPPLAPIGPHRAAFREGCRTLARRALKRRVDFDDARDLAQRYRRSGVLLGEDERAAVALAQGVLGKGEHDRYSLRCKPGIEAKIYATNTDMGIWPALPRLGCKLLVMRGRRDDGVQYPEAAAALIAQAAGCQLQTFDGLGHLGWIEAPQRTATATARAIRSFADG